MRTGDRKKLGLKALPLLLVILVLAGCTGVTTIPRGWSGGVVTDGILFVGSMEGQLVAVSTADGSSLWEVFLETPSGSGGGFACAPSSTAVAIYGSPTVAEDLALVYVGGYNGKVYTFAADREALRDEPRWIYPRQGNIGGAIVGGLAVAQGRVFFGSADGKVYALNAADGFKDWEFPLRDKIGKIWSTPTIGGDTLFIGSFDKKLYAIDTATGKEKWTKPFETGGAIVSTPVFYDNTVFIGSFDRYLYAINAADGSLKWKVMADNWFWAKPVIHNGVIYAANLDGKVYALETKSGNELAVFDLGSPLNSSPVLADGLIVVAAESGAVYVLDTENNQPRQLVNLEEKVYAPLAASQGTVYIHTDKDTLFALDARSGAIRKFDIK